MLIIFSSMCIFGQVKPNEISTMIITVLYMMKLKTNLLTIIQIKQDREKIIFSSGIFISIYIV